MDDLVQECLECPVCLEVCFSPISQCVHGHISCSSCRQMMQTCGLCKSKLSDIPNCLANELSKLVKLPCKFAHNGCAETVEQRLMEKHMKECPFKIRCQLKERSPANEKWMVPCDWIGIEVDMRDHVMKKHKGHGVLSGRVTHLFPIRRKIDGRFLQFEKRQFWSMVVYDFPTYTMRGMTFCVGSPAVASHYAFTYTLRPQNWTHDIVVQGNVVGTKGLNPDLREYLLTEGGSTVVICQGQATMKACLTTRLADKQGQFECRLTISRK